MVLDRLTRGEPDRSIAQLIGQLQLGEHLFGGHDTAGNRRADHHHIPLARTTFRSRRLAGIPVVLLVHSVVLEQLDRVLGKGVGRLSQLLGNAAPQMTALALDPLQGALWFRH